MKVSQTNHLVGNQILYKAFVRYEFDITIQATNDFGYRNQIDFEIWGV